MDYTEKISLFRQRFYGRQDVYGKGWSVERDGKTIIGYSPACENYWSSGCHIKLKSGITCSQCKIQKHQELTDDVVKNHIIGVRPLLQYILLKDSTVLFAAIDFDMKPGKEKLGYTFEDVKRASDFLNAVGIPHGIARSTGMGHHLYIFFSTPVPARLIRSIFWWLFDKVGFSAESTVSARPLPEMFPKQAHNVDGSPGSGIKPPMIEPNFEKGRNCFITSNNEVIPPDQQWSYLGKIPTISLDAINAIIEREGITLETEAGRRTTENPWQAPTTGSIHKVLEGCAAFRKIKEKCDAGVAPSHHEGFALWHMCLSVADGEDWFLKNAPGWGRTEAELAQLQHSKNKNYKPWSCKTMQEQGICVKGTKCFNKRPPLVTLNGVIQEDTTIPESEWPSPSPYRYAVGRGEAYLASLLAYVDEICNGTWTNEEKKTKIKEEVIKPGTVFDPEQQEELKEKIEETGVFKKSQLNKQFKDAQKEQEEKQSETISQRSDSIVVGSYIFRRSTQPFGYFLIKGVKGDDEELKQISNFVLDIEEEQTFIEDSIIKRRVYVGKFRSDDSEIRFEIPTDIWEGNDFSLYFANLVGSRWLVSKKDLDYLRLVSIGSTVKDMYLKPKIQTKQICDVQGWHGDAFVMPSVHIDKDGGVQPNNFLPINISEKEHAKYLDFSILELKTVREVMTHIKNDLFKAFPEMCVFNAIGFSMMAGIVRHFGFKYMPTLWFEGESGTGKTALCMLMQRFWGDFKGPLNWATTEVSMKSYAHDFKDTLLLVDDFKELGGFNRSQICQNVIQSTYEYSVRGASRQDGKQREVKFSRCLFMMTGEETPVHETSFIARLLLIYYPKQDTTTTREAYERCQEMSEFYKAVTPHFIHWVLMQNMKAIKEEFKQMVIEMKRPLDSDVERVSNSDRIAYNICLGNLGWHLFLDFMNYHGILSSSEVAAYKTKNQMYCEDIRSKLKERCAEEKNSFVFINRLKELLHSQVLSITGVPGFEMGEKIGFVDDDNPGLAYLYADKTLDEIKRCTTIPLTLNKASIGSQLKNLGVLVAPPGKESRNSVQKTVNNMRIRVWQIDLSKLDIGVPFKPRVVKEQKYEDELPPMTEDGIW